MFEPFIFINTCAIKPSKAPDFEKHFAETVELVRAEEPRLLHFAAYVDEAGSEASIVQVHPDAESMGLHMQVVAQHVAEAQEFLDFSRMSLQVCGTASDAVLERMRQLSGPGVHVSVETSAGGFNRLSPQPEATRTAAEPLIFVNNYALHHGKLDAYKAALPEWFSFIEANHPRMLHFAAYPNRDGTDVTIIQVHPDAKSMELQLKLIGDVHATWQEYIDWSTMRLLVCGRPSDALMKGLREVAGSGVPVSIKTPAGGFNRLPAL